MAMAAVESIFSILSLYPSPSAKSPLCPNSLPFLKLPTSSSIPPILPIINASRRKLNFQVCSTVQEITADQKPEKTQKIISERRKLFVLNLPWTLSVADIKTLFGECGTVADVEIIKQNDGRSRGFAFVTMVSGEAAQAVIEKFNSHELLGRVIRVEFAKRFKKPSPPPPTVPPSGETLHKLYVSNLAWKVRSNHLRDFFAANFKPVSARVVFDSHTGRSAGYGFVSFATREEAVAAISGLDGKELLGRPLRLKFSEKNADEPEASREVQHIQS